MSETLCERGLERPTALLRTARCNLTAVAVDKSRATYRTLQRGLNVFATNDFLRENTFMVFLAQLIRIVTT
jgi:hypothetical protein